MHILMTANSAWNILHFRRPIVTALLAEGYIVTVLAPPDESVTELKHLGCRFFPLKMNVKGLNPLDDLKLIWTFNKIFRAEKPDVIISYTIKNNLFGAFAAKICNLPFIPNVTGLGTAFLSGGMLQSIAELLYRAAFKRLPVVFFQNKDDRSLFVGRKLISVMQAQLLPGSGIDLSHFMPAKLPIEGAPPIFLMIARVLRDKGVFEYIEAARQIKLKYPEAVFQLLGAIDVANRTAIGAEMVNNWQAEGIIEYLGTTTDVRPYIAAANCIVLPSYREGAPRTLIEAAAMARPLITTDVPGCRTVVDSGITGFLCEAKSSDSLAQACRQFLKLSYNDKLIMGKAGRAKMEREFDEAIVVKAYRNAISAVTHMKSANAPAPLHH